MLCQRYKFGSSCIRKPMAASLLLTGAPTLFVVAHCPELAAAALKRICNIDKALGANAIALTLGKSAIASGLTSPGHLIYWATLYAPFARRGVCGRWFRWCSSVVERVLGKDEVTGSIPFTSSGRHSTLGTVQ